METGTSSGAPPAYSSAEGQSVTEGTLAETAAAFSSLNLSQSSSEPTADACLAHLRVLFAFEELKTRIGLQDGLWDIWDSRAREAGANAKNVLAVLREKRWAVFIARAVSRYEAWWQSFVPDMLKESDMTAADHETKERYLGFTASHPTVWAADMLPPLGECSGCGGRLEHWVDCAVLVRCPIGLALTHAESKIFP
jgi:hypothetical protein